MRESENEEEEGEGKTNILNEREEALKLISSIIELLIERTIPEKRRALTLKKAGKCLQILGKIWNISEYPPMEHIHGITCGVLEEKLMDMEGYVDEYQYLHIQAVDMALTDIKVIPKHFIWLLSADLSGNRLTNTTACPVTKLPNLVALKLNRNRFEDPYLPPMKHLQYLGLNNNKITSLHRIYHPNLETLDLNFNLIRKVDSEDCWKHTNLRQLELRGNQLKTTSGIAYQSLVNLYLAQNQITDLQGLEFLINLKRLHLRDNPLSDLTDFSESNINLKYLNLRKCQIRNVEDIQNLSVLKNLEELIIKGNIFNPEREKETRQDEDDEKSDEELEKPEGYDRTEMEEEEEEEEDGEIRGQILTYVPSLVRIDKTFVTKEEKHKMRDILYDLSRELE